MAGITKSPQLRLSPETAKDHEGAAVCAVASGARQDGTAKAAKARRGTKERSLNMQPE